MRYATLTKSIRSGLFAVMAFGCGSAITAHAVAQSGEDRWLEVLASNASVADKCNACRELQTAGTEKSIPALAALLLDPAISHTSRMALEIMPYPAAGNALRDALGKTSGLTKSGIIDSLGERRDGEAVSILADALADSDKPVLAAAASALGKIGSAEAATALTAAHASAQGDDRAAVAHALVRCADRILETGQREKASAIYVKLMQPTEAQLVRMAALRGYLRGAGPDQAQLIVRNLANESARAWARQTDAGLLPDLPDAALRDLAANLEKLPVDSQVAVLAAIRLRGDKSPAPGVLQAAKSTDPAVRVAAIRALGIVGDAKSLPLLIEASAQDDAAGQAARQSLEIVCDPQVDEQIAALLREEKDPPRRTAWIALVEARRPAGAVSLLLQEAKNDHPAVRRRAMAALANLAGPKDTAAMAAAVLKAEKGAERDDAEKAVMLVCQQIPDADRRAEPVTELLKQSTPADRAALLPLCGRIGGAQAKREVQSALDSDDADLYEVGVRAICNWPDASVAGQLLELSEQATILS